MSCETCLGKEGLRNTPDLFRFREMLTGDYHQTHRFFQESRPGVISHSSSSYILCKDEELRCAVHYT